jgi:hypothetical protein
MAMPANKAVKVVRIGYDTKLAEQHINDAIAEIEAAEGTDVAFESTGIDNLLIISYAPKGSNASSGGGTTIDP